MTPLPLCPARARLKRGVRLGIARCGGVDGAGATAARCRSVAGDWNNLNHPAFPPLDCALALDEAALAQGLGAPILAALAAELGHVVIRLPSPGGTGEALALALAAATGEFGDVAHELVEAARDGSITARESEGLVREIDEAIAALARMRALAAARREDAA